MESWTHTPFLDFFRKGEVAADIRMLAAQGALAPKAHEQLALLVLLSSDASQSIRETAERTLSRIGPMELASFLARSDVNPDIKAFFARRGVTPGDEPARSADAPLVAAEGEDAELTAGEEPSAGEGDAAIVNAARERIPTVQRLSLMTITEKIKTAMRGTREERQVLIRDPNKLVALGVLSSPKLTEQEIETFARLASISEDVLRVIATSRTWIKNYSVVSGLTFNPKTPVALSMGFVNRLNERDVRMLSTDRNVPEPLRILARKILTANQARKR